MAPIHAMFCALLFPLLYLAGTAHSFDNGRFDNVAVYWGQNSYGAGHSNDPSNFQKRLSFYCNDNAIDVFPIAFVNVFFGLGGLPSLNLANTCNPTDNSTFPGTALPNCQSLASDIATCQSKGKIVTLSLGGATGSVGFQSDAQATSFAQTIWDLFLGGSSSTRPFGSAVLDGLARLPVSILITYQVLMIRVDLDIEGGTSAYYATFVNKIRSLSAQSSKKFYVTAAPQCVYPDAALSGVLNSASFDAIYEKDVAYAIKDSTIILVAYRITDKHLDNWARTISPNKNVKVYLGVPASSSAAGGGYVASNTLSSIAVEMRRSFPSFGGVMMWDASQAYANNRYDLAIKNALVSAGGTGFVYPSCSAPAFASGTNYAGGSLVSYGGYIWQAKWFASSQPKHDPSGEWSAVSACSSGSAPTTTTRSTTSTTTTPSTSQPPATTTQSTTQPPPTTTPTNGHCTGIPAWSSSVAYQGGAQVIFNSHVWTARWWTQADTPGGAAGVWTDGARGVCHTLYSGSTALTFLPSYTSSYWGQDSAGHQQNLGFYCNDDTIDAIPLAFLYVFFGKGGQPVIDFSNICGTGGGTFPGTSLADCSFMASDIKKCQAKGKIITLSLGGATADVGFSSEGQAASFAKTIWNMFLGGSGSMRPFGDAILDGVDLDIENGSAAHYATFVNALRSLMDGSKKRFYVTAAPQCPFPDAKVGAALNGAPFDAVYVQFYNNFCQTSSPSATNFDTIITYSNDVTQPSRDHWAKTQSANRNVRVYLGAPASAEAAGTGFVSSRTLIDVARDAQKKYSSFGGVMLWDADQAYTNNKYHVTVKNAISNGNSHGPADPPNNPQPIPTFNPATLTFPHPHQSPTPTQSSDATPSSSTSTAPRDPRMGGRVRRPMPTTTTTSASDDNNDDNEVADSTPVPRAASRFFRD
ncbi:hypothetical protein CVT24_004755 [Panaeolus cyanescens]|uniref:chitinase n=1 Tax=Panaeolus cyanescens TaxID=181874 RepID=A0A409VEH6_9AGAR|nr:hypothetical protein CVT24_004755 [Panaeolus cyanescens]